MRKSYFWLNARVTDVYKAMLNAWHKLQSKEKLTDTNWYSDRDE